LPLTEAYGTNSLWVETSISSKKFNPIKASYGDLIQFDGAKLHHGTEVNKTGQTRVSFDFRIVPKKIFDENESGLFHVDRKEFALYYNTIKFNRSYS
jgi:ectoine hydroxylase-related dioxygenase (phytanoyl-CoA dioxygenase family)